MMGRDLFLAKLREILADDELTEVQPIAPKTWDSFEVLCTIELVDKAGKRVNVAEILKCTTVSELLELSCSA